MSTKCDIADAPSGSPLADEEALVVAAQAGDRDALGKLLHACAGELRGRLSGKIGRRHRSSIDVADVMQVTFLDAFLCIKDFDYKGPGSFLAWLTRGGENNLLDAVRGLNREKRRPRQFMQRITTGDDSWATLAASVAKSSSTPSRTFSLLEAKEFLRDAIPKLPPVYQKVVELYHLAGLPAEEVGKLVGGRSQAAVFMLSARARGHLSDLLGGWTKFFSSND